MKENDGRAARRKMIRRMSFVVIAIVCFVSAFYFLVGFENLSSSSSSSIRLGSSNTGKIQVTEEMVEKDTVMLSLHKKHHEPMIQKILDGSLNLIDIALEDEDKLYEASSHSYDGVQGKFCQLDFELHKQNPAGVPMFRDLVSQSETCDTDYLFDLKTIADLAREYDKQVLQEGDSVPKVLDLGGVAFHESRCGSTLFANSMIGMNPEKHRVYSESAPPINAMKRICGETFQTCSKHQATAILRDVIYLMSRSNNPKETHVFFKIQSIGSRYIHIFRKAFPNTPWLFIYREPVQVMMSHFGKGMKHANCLATFKHPPPIIEDIALARFSDIQSARDLSPYEYCAAHLTSLTESALEHIEDSDGLGIPINYVDLPKILYETIIPYHFHIPINQQEIDNIIEVSSVYSKGRNNKDKEWKDDSEKKEEMASDEIRDAADVFLGPSYQELQEISETSIAALKKS